MQEKKVEVKEDMSRFNAVVNRAKHVRLRSILSMRHETISDWIDAKMEEEFRKLDAVSA